MDSLTGEPIFYECVVCGGSKARSRRSSGRQNCRHDSCKGVRRQTARPQDSGTLDSSALDGTLEQVLSRATTAHQCFEVKELGVSVCLNLTDRERRAGKSQRRDEDICCQVRGGWGEDEDDGLIPGTRWVELSELVANVDESQLKLLDAFTKKMATALTSARKRIKQRQAEAADQ